MMELNKKHREDMQNLLSKDQKAQMEKMKQDRKKIAEIDANPAVSVTFQSRAQFASVHGNAYIVRDRALIEKLWSEAWRIWFPGGKDDPSLCLIRVEAREGEYWDNAGTQGVKYVLEAVKAYAKGETPNVDAKQNAKVGL